MDMQTIDKMIAEGNYGEAMLAIDSSLGSSPNDIPLLMAKAKVLIANKKESDAIPVLEKVISVDPAHILSAKLLSRLYTVNKDTVNTTKYNNLIKNIEAGVIPPPPPPPPASTPRVMIKQEGSGGLAVPPPPSSEDPLMNFLISLVKVPNLEGAMLTDLDGLPIKYHFKEKKHDFEHFAAVTQAVIKASRDILKNIGMDDVASVTVSMTEQTILISSIENVVLSVFVNQNANQGLVKLETKRVLDKIVASLKQT
jgi:predicted regulator of Ras-like GTPase activity (Roadblock/LC7/MglB family)